MPIDSKTTTQLKVAGAGLTTAGGVMAATVVGAVPGAIVAAIGAGLSIAANLGGSKYTTSTGVRWLTQMYQYFKLGDSGVTSDNKVDESKTAEAQQWFSYVLGVPIFDKYRWHALEGSDPEKDTNLNLTDQQKVDKYMAFPEVATWAAQITDPQGAVMNAVQIAKTMNDRGPAGSWANFPPANFVPPISGTTTGTTNGAIANGALFSLSNLSPNVDKGIVIGGAVLLTILTIVVIKKVVTH